MKSRETLIRLKKFQVDERRRKVAQIETMIAEFDRMAGDLEREIRVEQDRAGIHDPGHFAYPTYAKAAIGRRENLKRSADELRTQLEDAKLALGDAFDELKKVELLDERDQMREREAENAAEQTELEFDRADAGARGAGLGPAQSCRLSPRLRGRNHPPNGLDARFRANEREIRRARTRTYPRFALDECRLPRR